MLFNFENFIKICLVLFDEFADQRRGAISSKQTTNVKKEVQIKRLNNFFQQVLFG